MIIEADARIKTDNSEVGRHEILNQRVFSSSLCHFGSGHFEGLLKNVN